MCLCMGLITNRPFALASGMGLNAVVTFSVIGFQQANVPWQVGMSVIFVEGLIILVLVLTGLREAVMNAIPLDLKRAIGVGIGLFITTIGLNEGGFIAPERRPRWSASATSRSRTCGSPSSACWRSSRSWRCASRATSSGASSSPPWPRCCSA